VKFPGHIVSERGLETHPEKVTTVRSMPTPTEVKGVLQVPGLLNYFRDFIRDFAEIAYPLTQLLERIANLHGRLVAKMRPTRSRNV
jgi:hypothetical protein